LGAGEEEVLIGSIGGGAELETVAAAFDDMAVRVAELRRNDRESVELQRVRADQLARAHEELTATHISLQNAQRQLVDTSRRAGMAEVATNVLHNVGNVLNTVNVSADVLRRGLHDSKQTSLERAVRLFPTEPEELRRFLSDDPKSDKVAALLTALAAELRAERDAMTAEVSTLVNNIDHLKRVVSNQQQMATHRGGVEVVAPAEVLDAALLLQSVAETDVAVQIVRDYAPVDPILIDRHRVLQVVLNLLSNARHALRDGQLAEPRLVLRLAEDNDQLVIEVEDNGVGIDPDHIDALFQHGFTTKTDGHGFGLHDGANAAAEMGGSLEAHSAGPGHGARFALRLPLARPQAKVAAEHSGVRPRPSDAPHPSTGVI
jgi:signal transduction histidine kinase